MFCSQCGTKADDGARYCPQCGQAVAGNVLTINTPPSVVTPRNDTMGPPLTNRAEIPPEIRGWNWGAFGAGIFWTAAMKLWNWFAVLLVLLLFGALGRAVAVLVALPIIGINIYLGVNGNELAWKAPRTWQSVEQFKATQAVWAKWGFALLILGVLLPFILLVVGLILWMIPSSPQVGGY